MQLTKPGSSTGTYNLLNYSRDVFGTKWTKTTIISGLVVNNPDSSTNEVGFDLEPCYRESGIGI